MKQTLTPGNIVNIGKFIDIAQTYVKTNIPIDIMKQYVAPAVNFNVDNFVTVVSDAVSRLREMSPLWNQDTDYEAAMCSGRGDKCRRC